MGNIFIKETRKFYNYITSTHCKDFKDRYLEYRKYKYDDYLAQRLGVNLYKRKRRTKALKMLYEVLPNEEYINIKNYIFKNSSEEDKFGDWVSLIRNFIDFVIKFSDPALLVPSGESMSTSNIFRIKYNSTNTEFEFETNIFKFYINFEKTKIKKNNSSLFDTITGLDKENTFSFIKIDVTNKATNTIYNYKYMEDSSLVNLQDLEDDICDSQLEYIKSQLDEFIYKYMKNIFDLIVTRELNLKFNLYSYNFLINEDKELREKWLNGIMVSNSIIEDKS